MSSGIQSIGWLGGHFMADEGSHHTWAVTNVCWGNQWLRSHLGCIGTQIDEDFITNHSYKWKKCLLTTLACVCVCVCVLAQYISSITSTLSPRVDYTYSITNNSRWMSPCYCNSNFHSPHISYGLYNQQKDIGSIKSSSYANWFLLTILANIIWVMDDVTHPWMKIGMSFDNPYAFGWMIGYVVLLIHY